MLGGAAPGHPGFLNAYSDQDGRLVLRELTAGTYQARASLVGYWPCSQAGAASEHPEEQTLQLQRLGSLELELERADAPLPDVRVELVASQLGLRVADWVASGVVRASTGELRTDGAGRLRIDGLPHGPYRWSVELDAGGALSGEIVVPPAAVGHARIQVP